ncbi:MAG TPA: hypothetical protein VH305_11240 [Gaiella sp.]
MHFTSGEQFFPMDVEPYVDACSLWLYHPDDRDEQLIPEGAMTMDALIEPRAAEFGSLFYLRFIGELDLAESTKVLSDASRRKRRQELRFRAGIGRLARGGLLPRLGDALFSATLLIRGRVPGATAAAAELKAAELREADDRFVYHGRVVRHGGWVICQYWFFFAYNNWRSGYHGVNDHESDWEMIAVYLYEDEGSLIPEWFAYASHDFHGADLRRRFDDPTDLRLEGAHPVVFAGAGSHASYFQAGEYQAAVPLPVPRRIEGALAALDRFWRDTLGQGGEPGSGLRIPFVDFARGDGVSVGPGQTRAWSPNPIDEKTPWVNAYRGLWGLYAQDPIAGENAPAGPMYNRDGSVRSAWFDPLGFAELDKVPPPPEELSGLEKDREELAARREELERIIPERASALQQLGVELLSMQGSAHLGRQHTELAARVEEAATEVKGLRRELAENHALTEAVERQLEAFRQGRRIDPRSHIRKAALPTLLGTMRFGRAAQVWAALSLSALFAGLAVLIIVGTDHLLAWVLVLLLAIIVGESFLRGTFVRTVNRVAVLLALLGTAILVVHFWEWVLVGALLAFAAFLVVERVRELRA